MEIGMLSGLSGGSRAEAEGGAVIERYCRRDP